MEREGKYAISNYVTFYKVFFMNDLTMGFLSTAVPRPS